MRQYPYPIPLPVLPLDNHVTQNINFWSITFIPPPTPTKMPESYVEVEERITQAIAALHARKNVSRIKIAWEFCVPIQRLRSKLNGHSSARIARGLHLRKMAPDQEKALYDSFMQLDKISMPARLNMMETRFKSAYSDEWIPYQATSPNQAILG